MYEKETRLRKKYVGRAISATLASKKLHQSTPTTHLNAKFKLKILSSKSGITLIALIITIIVMLILVGVTVNIAINGGIFSTAKSAVSKTEKAMKEEQRLIAMVNASANNQTWTYTAKDKIQVPIPAGFAPTQIEGEDKVEDGLVIVDSEGNEFVWIPVNYEVSEGEEKNEKGLYPSFLKVFYISKWVQDISTGGKRGADLTNDDTNIEPYKDGYLGEDTEYNEMMKSVQENKGFYIGRYEAGSETARTNQNAGEGKMVVKRDVYPYNYVAWGATINNIDDTIRGSGHGAVYLCKHFYDNKDVGVICTLCYGVQWDAMMDFIKSENINVFNSTTWGNYKNNNWTITNQNAKYSTDVGATWKNISNEPNMKKNKGDTTATIFLTTGASDDFAAKNIYDIAGNCREWTMEMQLFEETPMRAVRGRILWT